MRYIRNGRLAVLGAVVMMSAASMAYGYYSAVPDVQHEGNVTYITGGVGDEERTAMEAVRGQYNLRITSFGKDGAFTSDSAMVIYDKMGNEILSTDAGPIFYAKLPAGKYIVSSTYEGLEQKKEVKVKDAPASVHFIW